MSTTVSDKLYELVDLRRVIDGALEATEGELTDDIAKALDAWTDKFESKCESIALYLADLEGDMVKLKTEEDRLAARRKSIAARCAWLENYVLKAMEATGRTKVEGALKTLSLRKNQRVEEVVPTSEKELSDMYGMHPRFVRFIPATFEWDKIALKDAAKKAGLPDEIAQRVRIATTHSLTIR